MYEFKLTGGAKYGMVSASWPFAKLKVTNNKLELNISLFGNLVFKPADVVSIVPYSSMPLVNGIRINHTVNGYNKTVVFTSFTSTTQLLKEIGQTGFMDNKEALPVYDDLEITALQSKGGFAMKTWAAIAIFVIWNVLFLQDFIGLFKTGKADPLHFGMGARLAFGFMIALCVALIVSEPVRNLVLKEGRTFNDIKAFVYFLMFIATIMLVIQIIAPQQFPH